MPSCDEKTEKVHDQKGSDYFNVSVDLFVFSKYGEFPAAFVVGSFRIEKGPGG